MFTVLITKNKEKILEKTCPETEKVKSICFICSKIHIFITDYFQIFEEKKVEEKTFRVSLLNS